MQINEIGAPVNFPLGPTLTKELDHQKPDASPAPLRRLRTERQKRELISAQHNGRIVRADQTVELFVVPVAGRDIAFTTSEQAVEVADEQNANAPTGDAMVFARKAQALIFDSNEAGPQTAPILCHVPSKLLEAVQLRCAMLGVSASRLVAALLLEKLIKQDDSSFAASPIRALDQWAAGKMRIPKWLQSRFDDHAAGMQPTKTNPDDAQTCSSAANEDPDCTAMEQNIRDIVDAHAISNFAPCFSHFRE